MTETDSRWLSWKRVDCKGMEWGSLLGTLQQELPVLGYIGFDPFLSCIVLFHRLSELAWGSCPFLVQKMAELLNWPSHPNPTPPPDPGRRICSFQKMEGQTERSGPPHHSRVWWLMCVLVSLPLPLPLPPARLWTSWKEKLCLTQMLSKCISVSERSHGDVKGMAKNADQVTAQVRAHALSSCLWEILY